MIRPGDAVLYRTATRARQRLGWVREVRTDPPAAKVRKRTRHHWMAMAELTLLRQSPGPAHTHEFDI